MDVMIWQAMYGNGVMTGLMQIITAVVQQIIRRVLRLGLTVFFAAVPGTSLLTATVLRFATGTLPTTTGAATSVFGAPLEQCNDVEYLRIW